MKTVLHVLLVEGLKPVRELIEHCVTDAGYKIISVESFGKAKEILKTQKFDVVLATEKIRVSLGNDLLAHVAANHRGTKRWLISYKEGMPINNVVVEEVFYTSSPIGIEVVAALEKLAVPEGL